MGFRSARPRQESTTRRLLCCGAAAGPLFVTTFLLEGAARADYDALRHPVSSLALGPGGWVQVANFSTAGALYLAGSIGLGRIRDRSMRSRLGAVLVGGVGLGLIGSGAFATDPIGGYPPGTPDLPAGTTTAGALHDLFGVAVFLGLPAAALGYAWRFLRAGHPGWAAYSAGTAVAMLVTFGLAGSGFSQAPSLVHVGGLFQRASIAIGFGWLTAVSVHALRSHSGSKG